MLIENNQYLLNTIFFVYHKHGLSVKLLFYCPAIFLLYTKFSLWKCRLLRKITFWPLRKRIEVRHFLKNAQSNAWFDNVNHFLKYVTGEISFNEVLRCCIFSNREIINYYKKSDVMNMCYVNVPPHISWIITSKM